MKLNSPGTSYAALSKKFSNFEAPTLRLVVAGAELIDKKDLSVQNLVVELTCDYPASGCTFDAYNLYEPKKTDFDRTGAFKTLQIGADIEVKLGYIQVETVFYGLITQVSYVFDSEGDSPYIHVECMDAKCLLMKTRRLEISNDVKIAQAVETLLGQQPVSSYLKGKKVEAVAGNAEDVHTAHLTDYDFIVRQAQYFGYEFFIISGEAVFRKTPERSSPVIELAPDKGILSATVSLRGEPLVEAVTVTGVNPANDKQVKGTAKISGKFGLGSTPKKMFAGTEQFVYDPRVIDSKTASSRAEAILDGLQRRFGTIECCCIGMPVIIPGRHIKLDGLMKEAKGTFYVTAVRHEMGEDGFLTTFEARMKSL